MNFGDHPHTIHGNAWQRAWDVASQSADRAELLLHHDPAHDPTATDGELPLALPLHRPPAYALHPDGLTVTITFTNTDRRAQPVGLGLHPYQPRTPQTAIALQAASVWHTGADSLPDARLPVEGHWSFDPGHAIDGPPLDNCYAAWSGRATVTRPEHGIQLTIAADDIFRHAGGLHAGRQAVFRRRARQQHDGRGQPHGHRARPRPARAAPWRHAQPAGAVHRGRHLATTVGPATRLLRP